MTPPPLPSAPGHGDEPRPDTGRLLTVPGAAVYLGVSPWSIRRLIWEGVLPSVRLGRLLYVDRRDLDVLPDRLKHRAASSGAK